jgi:hypothetical protein
MPQEPLEKSVGRVDKLTRTLFFLCALLFHLVLFMAVAGFVIWRTPVTPPDVVLVTPSPQQMPEPPATLPVHIHPEVLVHTPDLIKTDTPLAISPPRLPDLTPKIADSSDSSGHLPTPPSIPSTNTPDNWDNRIPKIKHMIFDLWHRTPGQVAGGDPSCAFPVYVASYANGDWACSTRLDKDGNIVAGAIPDLVAKISEWSHGKVKGEVVPKPLNVASSDLIDKMPPFIFFTGHKDFTLTQAEVDNLREYLNDGGCIWGDNALAGEGSRFDVAFRREMKRVIPDRDKNFVPYSVSDDIFTKGRFPLSQIPAGMNFYAEPPEHLDIGGILAILYTPNDYSDMMFMRINPGDATFFMTNKPIPPGTLYTNTSFVEKRSIFYRNFDLESSLAVHRMGMDIVTYLIIRFDAKLLLGP